MFTIISQCYDRRLVFASLWNFSEFKDRLQKHYFTDINWKVLKSLMHFLSDSYNCIKMASGSCYATISMRSLIFKRLLNLCEGTMSSTVLTGFKTVVHNAAGSLKLKLVAYKPFLFSQNNMTAFSLNPRSANFTMKAHNS